MPHLRRKSLIAAAISCATGVFLCTANASAQTETFDVGSFLGGANHTTDFVLPSFDTSLGILDSVDIVLKVNLCPVITVTNSTGAPISWTNAFIDVPVDITGPGAVDLTLDAIHKIASGTTKPGTTKYDLPRTSTVDKTSVALSDLDLWEDQPGNKVSIDMTPDLAIFGGTGKTPGLTFGGNATEWGRVTVTYNYSPIATPEPRGEYLTAIVGLAMLAVVLRRRKSTQV